MSAAGCSCGAAAAAAALNTTCFLPILLFIYIDAMDHCSYMQFFAHLQTLARSLPAFFASSLSSSQAKIRSTSAFLFFFYFLRFRLSVPFGRVLAKYFRQKTNFSQKFCFHSCGNQASRSRRLTQSTDKKSLNLLIRAENNLEILSEPIIVTTPAEWK